MKSTIMEKKKVREKPLKFRDAIELALHTPKLTHKQIDQLRREGKLPKKR